MVKQGRTEKVGIADATKVWIILTHTRLFYHKSTGEPEKLECFHKETVLQFHSTWGKKFSREDNLAQSPSKWFPGD